MATQLTATLLNELIDDEIAKYIVEKEGCKGNPLHRYKDGQFTSKKTRGSYSLGKSKIPPSCDRPTGQHSRKKGSDKPQQNKKPCGRKDRRKLCRGGSGLKEQEDSETSLEPTRTGVERPQMSLDTPNYLARASRPLQSLTAMLEPHKKTVGKMGLSTTELGSLVNVFVDAVVEKVVAAIPMERK
jgi:hypothetical protein